MLPTVVLPAEIRTQLERAALAAWPAEMVGILLGTADGSGVRVTRFAELPNGDLTSHRFAVDPIEFAATLAAAERHEPDSAPRPEFLGFVHSHPTGRAEPSPADLRELWRDCVHAIVGVERVAGATAPRVTELWAGRIGPSGSEPHRLTLA